MRLRSRIIRRLRIPLLALAMALAIAPAGAVAQGDTPADYPGVSGKATATPAPVVGDTPADYPGVSRKATATPARARAGVSRKATTVEVVRPERTIVRDADEVLPIALASLALLIALGGVAYVLVRTRSSSPARVGDAH